jgi:hypothetical protein
MTYFNVIIKIVILMPMYRNNSTVSGNLSLRTNDGRDEIRDLFANKCMFATLDTRKVESLAYPKPKKKVETMDAQQNRRFDGKKESLALWPSYIGEKGRTLGKTYGTK